MTLNHLRTLADCKDATGVLRLALIMAMVFASATALAQDDPRSAIELYFQAHALGKSEYIKQTFAPEARISSIENGRLIQWNRDEFASRFREPAQDEFRRVRRVERLDVKGNTAGAIITFDYPETLFTHHLSLLKIDGQWKIISDVFSADQRNSGKNLIKDVLQNSSLPFEPRRIIGNIYYVGTNAISSFLIVTPGGHILLDTGNEQMLSQVEANIAKLGFKPRDVKFLLNSQAHFDHCGGFAEFKRRTAATVVASKQDGDLMIRGGKGDFYWGDDLPYEPVTPDRYVADGDLIQLGGSSLTAHLTPGHTKGCTSWSMRVNEQGKDYDVLFLCGLTLSLYKLTNNAQYPDLVEDVRNTFARLRTMHADVLLGAHGSYFDLETKASHQKDDGPNPFINQDDLTRHLDVMERALDQALQAQERQR